MKRDDWRIYGSSGGPLPPEMQAALDRYTNNLKAEQRRKHPELLEFARRLNERRAREAEQGGEG